MADEPEAVRLARNWRAHAPPDRSPAYIADDLARSVLSQHDENTRLRAALAEALRIADAANNDPGSLEDHQARNARIAEMRREWKIG